MPAAEVLPEQRDELLPSTQQQPDVEDEEDHAAQDKSNYQLSSILAQMNSQDIIASCQETPKLSHHHPPAYKSTWKSKLQSFLCCFAPAATHPYFRASRPDPLAPVPATPDSPSPHRLYTEALIGPKHPDDTAKKTLVLDLDETLVHSSFKPLPNPDFIIPIDIDGKTVDVYVLKRPGLDEFMATIGPIFEVVVFTASLSKYADPLLDLLDPAALVRWRLFREACCPWQGNYVKDLNCLGRNLADTIIVDNSPYSYVFQPFNAVPIGTFIDDMADQELLAITPTLLRLQNTTDVREYITQHVIHRSAHSAHLQ